MKAPLVLAAELTIAYAADMHGRLLAASADGAALPGLDLSAVSDIDSAGVQLLLSAARSQQARGQALALHAPSAAVRAAFAVYGLADWLQQAAPAVDTAAAKASAP